MNSQSNRKWIQNQGKTEWKEVLDLDAKIRLKTGYYENNDFSQFQLICPMCCRHFSRQDSLKRHIEGMHNSDPQTRYDCEQCGKQFRWERNLRAHIKNLHQPILNWLNIFLQMVTDNNTCTVCFRQFSRKDSLKRHFLENHDEARRLFQCDICNKTFKRRDHMIKHAKNNHTNHPIISNNPIQ